jgi:hypothetical protein
MTRLVLGDLILESLTPNVNAPLCNLTVELCMLYSWGGMFKWERGDRGIRVCFTLS